MPDTAGAVRGYRCGFGAVLCLVLAILVLTPVAILSLVHELRSRSADRSYSISLPDDPPGQDYSRLRVDVLSLDEVGRSVTLRVAGFTLCRQDCNYTQKVVFFSIGADSGDPEAVPPSESITLPATSSEISQKITLPLRGELISYPFDSYHLTLGALVKRVNPDGSETALAPAEANSRLFMTIRERIPRLNMAAPRLLDPAGFKPEGAAFSYLYVNEIGFARPLYLKILIVLIVLLIAAASLYAVILRPFDQLIINAGALVLGVWGVRSLLLGAFPPDVTIVDISLTGIIFLSLCGITFRALLLTHGRSKLSLWPGRRRPAPSPATTSSPGSTGSEEQRAA